ncbi:MAG: hypothetical protein AB7Q42_17355 [Acidimicrobiia bacterium]
MKVADSSLASARRIAAMLVERARARPRPVAVVVVGALLALVLIAASTGGADRRLARASPDATSSTTEVASSARAAAPVPRSTTTTTTTTTTNSNTGSTSTTIAPTTTAPSTTVAVPPAVDPESPAVVARPIPVAPIEVTPPAPAPPWAWSTRTTPAGLVVTDVGCAAGTSAAALDAFFAARIGPLLGTDYQHLYPLGDGRSLWLFQDAFLDHSGGAERLSQARFAHNIALVQDGACFTLQHRGTAAIPTSFEGGTGEQPLTRWFWPMGGEVSNGRLQVFWAEMVKDGYEPGPGDGLGWHPAATWLATYDTHTLTRLSFAPAPNSGVTPIYGYAVSSDASYTYLFGNSFEQNLTREGGFWSGPHSGAAMWLARVPLGELDAAPEYRTDADWSPDPGTARPFLRRYWTENPMQPRYVDGQWVSATKVDGYWGEELSIDVALDPWGPWTTVQRRVIAPRGGDPAMNTYHAHLLPWRENGSLVVVVSQNARDMLRDAYPNPWRYRPAVFTTPWAVAPPPPPPPPPPPDTTVPETTATLPSATTTSAPSTTIAPTTSTSPTTTTTTTVVPTTTTSTTTTTASPTTVVTVPPTTVAAPATTEETPTTVATTSATAIRTSTSTSG